MSERKGEDKPGPKVTYAEAVSRPGAGNLPDRAKFVGRRNIHEISIQTFPTEGKGGLYKKGIVLSNGLLTFLNVKVFRCFYNLYSILLLNIIQSCF